MKKILYFGLFLILCLGLVFATDVNTGSSSTDTTTVTAAPTGAVSTSWTTASVIDVSALMSKRTTTIVCNAAFLTDTANAVIGVVPRSSATLTPLITRLQGDVPQLQTLSSQGSASSQAYLSQLLLVKGDMTSLTLATAQAVRTGDVNAINNIFATATHNYATCNVNALVNFADARLQINKTMLEKSMNAVTVLNSKSVATTQINQVIADGQAFNNQFAAAVDAAKTAQDANALYDALAKYCFNEGCPKGQNFHYGTKLAIAQSQDLLNYLKAPAFSANLTADWTAGQTATTAASMLMGKIGNSLMTSAQATSMAEYISTAEYEITVVIEGLQVTP